MAAFFTELFRVAPDKVSSLLDPELERDPETSLWLKNIGEMELVGLWESLTNTESDGTMIQDILSDEDADAMLFSLPPEFLEAIAAVTDDKVDSIAEQWQETDEVAHWDQADLAQVIRDIRNLVQAANANNQIVVELADM
ncbi:hypothetical protein [Lignipirellula cremea]|uniref:Uncharacterized protein n=1 Tax=Lignipirellula cremea TaxID=2528010 RepID=A0A518E395_9BACT|nr:hypothetical protein [Lignipirellula cremea]QDU98568.1 hypothetical protein Pla8534_64390 [Lignipirellula cremea]